MGIQFELLGKIVAVAIYNGIILDLPFPKVLWRRMLTDDRESSLHDLAEIDSEVAKGLQQLLNFDGDVMETFDLTFSLNYESFGV
jgi:ubiquitin-protein ligase E3 A|eukprot:COSAG01_NODE_4568_length_4917_cov_3.350073_2_plen_85_part_00